MQSIIQHIHIEASKLKTLLDSLKEYSDLVRWNHSSIKISGLGDYQWDRLNDSGREIQEQLLQGYKHLFEYIRFLTTYLPIEQQRILETSANKMLAVINQTGNFFTMDREELFQDAIRALDLQLQIVVEAYEVLDSHYLIIPDSGALVANPELEKWNFEGIESFKLMLLPAIVAELDENTTDTNQVKNKIKTKILDYAKQGNIAAGVNLNEHNIIKFAGNIKEAKATLPGLDVHNKLDQLLAAYFEIAKINSHSQVLLITNNPGLQERARGLNIIYRESPSSDNTTPATTLPEVKQEQATPTNGKGAEDSTVATKPPRGRTSRSRLADKQAANKTVENKLAENKAIAAKPGKIKAADNRSDNMTIKISMPPAIPAIPQGAKNNAPKIKSDIFKPDSRLLPKKPKR